MAPLVWLITGCSSGFGEHFVHRILARGDKVIATARNALKINHLEKLGAVTVTLDVTNDDKSIHDTISKAIGIYGKIDVLVNNAGYAALGFLEDLEYEDWLAEFNTNVFGALKLARTLLPHFRERRCGTLVFVSSLSGWVGHPGCSAYAASKFALEGAVEALGKELNLLDFGIRTLLIEPGRFRTKFLSSGNMKGFESSIPDYIEGSKMQMEFLAKEDQAQPGDPVKLVEIIVDLVRQEGIAKDKEVPFRLPLGNDCFNEIKAKCEETLALLEKWEDVIRSTDLDS